MIITTPARRDAGVTVLISMVPPIFATTILMSLQARLNLSGVDSGDQIMPRATMRFAPEGP